jgi:hypothetical protein
MRLQENIEFDVMRPSMEWEQSGYSSRNVLSDSLVWENMN